MPTELFAIKAAFGVEVMYSFSVDGSVSTGELTPDISSKGELEENGGNVSITRTSSGYNVSGKTGDGFGDAFEVDGTIQNWSASADSSGYTLSLGGDRVGVSDFPVSTGQQNRSPVVSVKNVDVTGKQVSATAEASDPDGNLKEVSWALFESGSQDTLDTASGSQATFSLPSSGSYTLHVTATDSEGETDNATASFTAGGDGGGGGDGTPGGFGIDKRTLALGMGAFGVAYIATGGN